MKSNIMWCGYAIALNQKHNLRSRLAFYLFSFLFFGSSSVLAQTIPDAIAENFFGKVVQSTLNRVSNAEIGC